MKIKEIVARRDAPYLGLYFVLPDPTVIELAAVSGYDFIRIDMEHHTFSYDKLGDMLRVARLCGLRTEVRVSNVTDITKILNMGANGIVCPNVDTLEIAKEVVRYTKYAPCGMRGMYSMMPENKFGIDSIAPYLSEANENVTVTLQIESLSGIRNLDEILKLDGVDMIATGRGDLSQSMGLLGQNTSPAVFEQENHIVQKTLAAGKAPAILVPNRQRAQELWEQGVRIMLIGYDLDILAKGMKQNYDAFSSGF